MKRIFLLTIIALGSLFAYAQKENEFVQVAVSDTVLVEPEEFTYTIHCAADYNFVDTPGVNYNEAIDYRKNYEGTCLSNIRQLIIRMKLDTLSKIRYNFADEYRYIPENTISIIVYRRKKLDDFILEAEKIPGFSGTVTNTSSSLIEENENRLITTLIKKAYKKASLIARESQKNLGKLLSLQEVDEKNVADWTMYPPLSSIIRSNVNDASDKIILIKRLVVRYAWH